MSNTDEIIAESEAMKEVLGRVEPVAPTKVPVLITGETGVGKEVIARDIHGKSGREDKPFMSVNCAAFPTENLLNSEIFGHVQGAFTGATRSRVGIFKQADGGTIFLDEVGKMLPETQDKLLRVLETEKFVPLGGDKTINVDVRIIAATNANLEILMEEDKFSDALYYRLARLRIHIPPLRVRPDDIEPLVSHIIPKVKKQYRLIEKPATKITQEALNELKKRDWPGNVRQLESVIMEALVYAAKKEEIQLNDLPPEKQEVAIPENAKTEGYRNPERAGLKRKFEDTKQALEALLKTLKEKEKKELSLGDSDSQYLAAVILKREPKEGWSKLNWTQFAGICGVRPDTCKSKQTKWNQTGTVDDVIKRLKKHRPQAG